MINYMCLLQFWKRDIGDNYIQFLAQQTQPYCLPSGSLSLSTCLGEMAKKNGQ